MKTNVIINLIAALLFVSCSEITKEAAKSDLEGNYKGSSKTIMNATALNAGVKDEMSSDFEPVSVSIKRNEGDGIYFEIDNVLKLKINNVQLATNGSTFNIPEQLIAMNESGYKIETTITGLSEYRNGEARCDGFYDTEKNELTFSYGGNFNMGNPENQLEIPFKRTFSLSKVK